MKTCTVCGVQIAYRATSGLCKVHFVQRLNTDPAMLARQRDGIRKWYRENPEAVARRNANMRATWSADTDRRARAGQHMRTVCQPASATPESVARRDNTKRAKAISIGRNPWCPDEYRGEYLHLVKNRNIKGADARAMIEAQMKADHAALSPFERQERALAKGASLQDNFRIDRHSADVQALRAKLA